MEKKPLNRVRRDEKLTAAQISRDEEIRRKVEAEFPPLEADFPPPPPMDPLLPEQQEELDRRAAELDANPGLAMSWDEFQSRVTGKS